MKKILSVCITICLLVGMCSLSSFAATFAKDTYVEKINASGALLANNIKAIATYAFNISVTATAKTGISMNAGTKEVTASNVDELVTFKSSTSTLTFSKDLANYFDVIGTISGNNATITFSEKAANNMEVYQVISAINTSTDTGDVSAKLSVVANAEKYTLSPATLTATVTGWVTKLASVTTGVRVFGRTYDNMNAANFAKVTATVERINGVTTSTNMSVTDVIDDLMPGDRVTLKASIKDDADREFYGFYCWTDGAGNVLNSTSDTITWTMDGTDVYFYATFIELKDRFMISCTSSDNGRIAVEPQFGVLDSGNRISVMGGREVTFRIIPDEGYALAQLIIDGQTDVLAAHPESVTVDDPGTYSYTFKHVYTDHSIEAVFRLGNVSGCTAHEFGMWETVVAPTCLTAGLETRTCENCGLTQTRATEKAAHQWETVICPKTMEGIVYRARVCAVCGEGSYENDSDVSEVASGTFDAGTRWMVTSENELILFGIGQTDASASASDVPWTNYQNTIRSVTIGRNIRSIGAYLLSSCPNLTDVTYIGFEEDWAKVTVGAHNEALRSATIHFEHPKIVASDVSAGNIAGRKVRVSVLLENNPGIISTLIRVNYDTSKLRLTDVHNGAMLHMLETSIEQDIFCTGKDLTAVPYTSFWCADHLPWNLVQHLSPIMSGYPYDGTLLTYTFEILDGAESGVTPIEITYDDASTFDNNLEYVRFDAVSGSVNLIDCTPGDANDDGRISLMDAAMITRHVAEGYNITINEINADVNRDMTIDMKDAVLIKRYLAGGWGVELK